MDFYGNDIEVLVTKSPEVCQQKCQKNIVCHYWTFKKLSKDQELNCWLKRVNDFKITNSKRISGPKYCGNGIFMSEVTLYYNKITFILSETCKTTFEIEKKGVDCVFPFIMG